MILALFDPSMAIGARNAFRVDENILTENAEERKRRQIMARSIKNKVRVRACSMFYVKGKKKQSILAVDNIFGPFGELPPLCCVWPLHSRT